MHIKSLNENIADILSSLDNLIKVLVIAASDSDALASIRNDLLIIDGAQDFNNLFKEVSSLHSTHNALVLSQAASQAPYQILHEQLWLVLNAVSVQELHDCLDRRHLQCLVQVLIVN